MLNGAQNFLKPSFSRKVYTLAGNNVTPLSARCFGTWNITSAIIRIYAAYHLANPQYVFTPPPFALPFPCCTYLSFLHFASAGLQGGFKEWE